MKKFLLLTLFCVISIAASAQAYVGGTLGVGVTAADGESAAAFTVSPEAGYYFNKTWAVGGKIDYSYQNAAGSDISLFSILPYVRATFAHAGVFDFFGELNLGYAYICTAEVGGFSSALCPGVLAHINDKFSIVAKTELLSFSHFEGESGFGLSLNGNFHLGVQYTF